MSTNENGLIIDNCVPVVTGKKIKEIFARGDMNSHQKTHTSLPKAGDNVKLAEEIIGERTMDSRTIKFRQPIFDKDGFLKWHYWGFVEKGAFFGPMPPFDRDNWQFTGKKDIEGTDIYTGDRIEGDLFDKRLPTAGTILYDESLCCFVNKNEAGNTPLFYIDKIKVIGNIYEATPPSQGATTQGKEDQ